MIEFLTNLISTLGIAFLTAIASIFPTSTVSVLDYAESLIMVANFGKQLSFIIPWNTLWTAFITYTTLYILLSGYKLTIKAVDLGSKLIP